MTDLIYCIKFTFACFGLLIIITELSWFIKKFVSWGWNLLDDSWEETKNICRKKGK